MDLPQDIESKVEDLSESGNEYMEQADYEAATMAFEEALAMLPQPCEQWEAFTWLNASIGDAQFMLGDFVRAKESLFDALNGPDGLDNPFVYLRLGQCQLDTGEVEAAEQSLARAFMLGGPEIFEDEQPRYLECLKRCGVYRAVH
jgi:Tfp pilus assembly protein PilF